MTTIQARNVKRRDGGGPPETGALAVDTRTGRVGVVMDQDGPHVYLRPPSGGREWVVPEEAIRPARAGCDER